MDTEISAAVDPNAGRDGGPKRLQQRETYIQCKTTEDNVCETIGIQVSV